MPSAYYTPTGNPAAQSKGTSPVVRAEFSLLDSALQKLPTPQQINSGAGNYVADSGTANAYAVQMSSQVTALTAGLEVSFKAANANTGASTLTLTGVAANVPIVGPDGVTPLSAGAITAGMIVDVRYDGGNFQFRSGMLAGTQSPSAIQGQTYVGVLTAGSSTAYTVTPTPALSAYAEFVSLFVRFHTQCGTSPTLQISGVASPPSLVKLLPDGTFTNLKAGDIPLNHRSRVTLISTTQAWVETLPDSAASQGSRNRIINGSMQVSQYGSKSSTAASTSIYGGCDRYVNFVAATTVNATFDQALSPVGNFGASGVCQRMTLTTTGTTTLGWFQRIEAKNAKDLNSKTVTFSCKVYQATGGTAIFAPSVSKANAADNFGTTTTISTGANVSVPSGVVTTVSLTVTLGATDADNGIMVGLVSAGNGAQTGSVFYTADWWFDIGNSVPQYQPANENIATETLKCQRYAIPIAPMASGYSATTTAAIFEWQLPAEMRLVPSFTATATTSSIAVGASTSAIAGTWTSSVLGTRGVSAVFTRGAGTFTAGDGVLLNDTTSPFILSSEL